ncbi:hypothetical protein MNB_SM-5-1283 [hydrothermal vent metagenome]|uniref:Oxaloacetate decarboxylase gamma chain n=1 Tax=hydrothermal vent metagenome TaxID=652676 RepID=A0A1W1CYV6_9ZZZZ
MFLGMGTVFVFLIVMITCMNIMSSIINRYFPEPQSNVDGVTSNREVDNKKIVAAITAAITHHRKG